MVNFSIKEILNFSLDLLKEKAGFILKVEIVFFLLLIFLSLINYFAQNYLSEISFLINLLVFVGATVLTIGFLKIFIKLAKGEETEIREIYSNYGLFFSYLAGYLLHSIIIVIGLVLLVIPGIILAIRLSFTEFLIIDKKLSPIEALKTSFQMTKGYGWKLFLLFLVIGLISLLSIIFPLILFIIPLNLLSVCYAYKKLSENYQQI